MATAEKMCKLCSKATAKYTCPRCGLAYCSSACYKHPKHLECSEAFYKQSVMDELGGLRCSNEQRINMLRTLQKLEAEKVDDQDASIDADYADEEEEFDAEGQFDEDDDDDDLVERFVDLDVENDDIPVEELWKRLNEEERREFTELFETGEAAKFVPVWQPWWRHKDKLVEEMDVPPNTAAAESKCPRIPTLLSTSELNYSHDSLTVPFDVINCLYAYAFTMKLYNGDYRDFLVESAKKLMDISGCLGMAHHYSSVEFAVVTCMNQLQLDPAVNDYGTSLVNTIDEVLLIMQGPSAGDKSATYSISALADIQNLFKFARSKSVGPEEESFRKKLVSTDKMLQFFMSWLGENYKEIIALCPELHALSVRFSKRDEQFQTETKRLESTIKKCRELNSNHPKIEELN